MSKWLIALMNHGMYQGKQVLPASVVKASLEPSIAMPNVGLEERGYRELFNAVYGMARWYASYRGHYFAYHGGDIDGFHSQVSCMPYDSIGVIVFVIGDHAAPLYNVITYNIYERLLGMDLTPWNERRLADRIKGKAAGKESRAKAGAARVANAPATHPLADYTGVYEHPAYGTVTFSLKDSSLEFNFHKIILPLTHFHYDRFDSPNDEQYGLWSFSFYNSPQGEIDRAVVSLDENEVTFMRKPDASLGDPKVLAEYAGKYELAGAVVEVALIDKEIYLIIPGTPRIRLIPFRAGTFHVKEFSDLTFEFVREQGRVTAFKQIDPSGEQRFERRK